MALQGVDISAFQGYVDWKAMTKDGISFVVIKATEGIERDSRSESRKEYFLENWKKSQDFKVIRGAYHFFRANRDPILQAKAFLERVPDFLDEDVLPPILDIETDDNMPKSKIIARATEWLKIVHDEVGMRPIVYTYGEFANDYLNTGFGYYPLWIANYGTNQLTRPRVPTRKLRLPQMWGNYLFWQYSSRGQVKGISTDADLNIYHGTQSQLLYFISESRYRE